MYCNIPVCIIFLYIISTEVYCYDVVVIPIHLNQKRLKHKTTTASQKLNISRQNVDDMVQYEEPAEISDIDNFDYKDTRINLRTFDGMMDFDAFDDDGDDKIVGGFEADINLYPYHVAYGSNCGGAIIDTQWIITAGHCGHKPYIKVGSKYYSKGKKIKVKENFIHPKWTDNKKKKHSFDFDYQLVKIEEPFTYGENIQPIKIARLKDMIIGKVITVTGWGNMEEDGPYSKVLRAIRVPIIPKDKCQEVPFPYFKGTLTERMFCAGFKEATMDACQGDSGGPAVNDGRLLGMVSFGYGCATPGSYGVYSKVAKVRSWIEEVTKLTLD